MLVVRGDNAYINEANLYRAEKGEDLRVWYGDLKSYIEFLEN